MLLRLRLILMAILETFRFVKRYRLRQAQARELERQERAAEREHQFTMLETIFSKMVEMQKVNNEGLLALAGAQQAQADVLATWLKGFQISDPSPQPPQTVREEDEWVAEQRRLMVAGDPDAFPVDLPPEFQLAFAIEHLDKMNQQALTSEGFDREGSDFD